MIKPDRLLIHYLIIAEIVVKIPSCPSQTPFLFSLINSRERKWKFVYFSPSLSTVEGHRWAGDEMITTVMRAHAVSIFSASIRQRHMPPKSYAFVVYLFDGYCFMDAASLMNLSIYFIS